MDMAPNRELNVDRNYHSGKDGSENQKQMILSFHAAILGILPIAESMSS